MITIKFLAERKKVFFIAEDTSRCSSRANCYRVSTKIIHKYDSLYAKLTVLETHTRGGCVEDGQDYFCLVTSWALVHANEAKKVK